MATPVLMPKQGNTVEECLLTSWAKGKGDTVKAGDVIAEIETDKASFEIESPADGEILERFFEEGELVPVLVNVAVVGAPGEDAEQFRPEGSAAAEPEAADTDAKSADSATPAPDAENAADRPPAAADTDAPLSPRAQRFLNEHPFEMGAVAGSGPDGRILEKDVVDAYNRSPRLSPVAAAMRAGGIGSPAAGSGIGGMIRGRDMGPPDTDTIGEDGDSVFPDLPPDYDKVTVRPLSNIRRIIAGRMQESLRESAQYTLATDADITGLLALRQRIKAGLDTLDLGNINLNDMIMYAAVKALKRHPELNAEMIDGQIHQHSAVNLAFACDTPRGLMVPVIRDADHLTMREMMEQSRELARQCGDGSLSPDLLQGGSFTISALGSLGITAFTPVINYPQVAILGICASQLKPVRRDGEVVFVDHVSLMVTCDHRVVDGAPGARFLKTLKTIIENFDVVCMAG